MVWRSLAVYTSAPDDLLCEVILPFFTAERTGVAQSFWERCYASGVHWRVRVGGNDSAQLDAAIDGLAAACTDFLVCYPSAVVSDYDSARVVALLERESVLVPRDIGEYRVNVCRRQSYPDEMRSGMAPAGRELADEFRHQACRLVARFVGRRDEAFAAMARTYWLQALLVTDGDLAEGCVSYKSHWSGFAATFEHNSVVERIEATFNARSAPLADAATAVRRWYLSRHEEDAWLEQVGMLIADFMERIRFRLSRGDELTQQVASVDEQRQRLDAAREQILRPNAFVEAVWEDPRFLASIRHSPAFLHARAMTNLLYILVAAAGLSALDRQVLCRFAFGAAEIVCGEDLTERLLRNRSALIAHANAK